MVVVSGSWIKNDQYVNYGEMNVAKAVLIGRPNSHPFQERTLNLDQPVKVGRSVARARATPVNAIFDCKVLSRHHAVLFYENGKFFLQDTKSSNGTFVNNDRLSTNESEPHEVSSGDIVQFGVDVVENNRNVAHGCIVATLKLYLPDGKEAKASPSISEGNRHGMVPLDELYKLNQIIQEASQRELCLETKLTALQHVVDAARRAADESWQAYVGEERLLSRVAALETQLMQAGKNFGDDRIRDELKQLQEDRNVYQVVAKEALMKSHTERLEAVALAAEQERARATAENEVLLAKEQWERAQQELQEIAQKLTEEQRKADEEREKFEQKLKELQAHIEELQVNVNDNDVKNEQNEEDEEEEAEDENPNIDEELDPLDAIMKYDRILNDVKLQDENETSRNDINKTQEANEIIITTVESKDLPTNNESAIILEPADMDESIIENKDELTTCKEVASDETLSDTDTDEPMTICEIEQPTNAVSEVDTKTLKYQYQTVCEQKRQIEQLELLSSSNKTRIALLEKSLLNEKEEKSYLSSKSELLKDEYTMLETKYMESLNDTKELRGRVDGFERQIREQIEAVQVTTEERASQVDQQEVVDDASAHKRHISKLKEQMEKLEEEVVSLKERYAHVSEEKLTLNKELLGVHDKYNALCNRSHNTLFFYVAPLALMVLYLLVSSMFS